jgi:hypothetical protein
MSIGLAQAEISYGATQTSTGTAIGTAPPPAAAPAALPETPVAPLPAVTGDVPLPDAGPLPVAGPATVPPATVRTADIAALTAVRTPLHSDESWLFGVLAGVGLTVCVGAVLLIRGVRA